MTTENKILDASGYNDFLKSIKSGSPVHKVNFVLEHPNTIVGMYLITMEDTESYIDKNADYSDLHKNTLLVFEPRHVVECCQIIYGCLLSLNSVNMINTIFYDKNNVYEYIIDDIIGKLLTKPIFYFEFINVMDSMVSKILKVHNNDSKKLYDKIYAIFRNIWFVPYGNIDEMAKEAIEEFQKHCKDGDKINE